jgi:type IV pilus assembly protein PilM
MIGIDISDRSIKIVELVDSKKPKLHTVGWSPLPPNVMRRGVIRDVGLATAALQEALRKCSPVPVEGKTVVVSIPETQSFVRVLELPTMSHKELDEAVQWAVRQHIPFDLERVYLDWQPVSASSGTHRQVLVGAAQRDVVDPLLAVLDNLDLQVVALELEAQAIVRSLLPRDAADVQGVLIVDLGATSTNVIFFDRGVMRFTTSVQVGGDDLTQQLAHTLRLQPSIAAEKKALVGVTSGTNDEQVAATLHEATLSLIQRVEQVVREMLTQSPADTSLRAILLSGGSANLPGLITVFAEVFPGLPIEIGNPWINLIGEDSKENAPLSPADAAHFVTALGLALRQESQQ